jgi:hypothetical protein
MQKPTDSTNPDTGEPMALANGEPLPQALQDDTEAVPAVSDDVESMVPNQDAVTCDQDFLAVLYDFANTINKPNAKDHTSSRTPLFNSSDENDLAIKVMLETASLEKTDFVIGAAYGEGDCFFDSCAQALNQLKGVKTYTLKSVREICASFAHSLERSYPVTTADATDDKAEQNWIYQSFREQDKTSDKSLAKAAYSQYLMHIGSSASQMAQFEKQQIGNGLAIWGEAHLDGKIICIKENVTIHLIEIHQELEETGASIFLHHLIDSNGSHAIEGDSPELYNQPNMLHIVAYKVHFAPLVKRDAKEEEQSKPAFDFSVLVEFIDQKEARDFGNPTAIFFALLAMFSKLDDTNQQSFFDTGLFEKFRKFLPPNSYESIILSLKILLIHNPENQFYSVLIHIFSDAVSPGFLQALDQSTPAAPIIWTTQAYRLMLELAKSSACDTLFDQLRDVLKNKQPKDSNDYIYYPLLTLFDSLDTKQRQAFLQNGIIADIQQRTLLSNLQYLSGISGLQMRLAQNKDCYAELLNMIDAFMHPSTNAPKRKLPIPALSLAKQVYEIIAPEIEKNRGLKTRLIDDILNDKLSFPAGPANYTLKSMIEDLLLIFETMPEKLFVISKTNSLGDLLHAIAVCFENALFDAVDAPDVPARTAKRIRSRSPTYSENNGFFAQQLSACRSPDPFSQQEFAWETPSGGSRLGFGTESLNQPGDIPEDVNCDHVPTSLQETVQKYL